MKIALLCTPLDFHARKWAKALVDEGQEVIFIHPALDHEPISGLKMIPIQGRNPGRWDYLDFWWTVPALKKILFFEKPDIVNPLHVTPFGVWARLSGYRPVVNMVLGADVLDYVPSTQSRFWKDSTSPNNWKAALIRFWHRVQVSKSLASARFNLGDNQSICKAIGVLSPKAIQRTEVFTWGIPLDTWLPAQGDEKSELRIRYQIPPNAMVVIAPRGLKALFYPEVILEVIQQTCSFPEIHWVVLSGHYPVAESVRSRLSVLTRSGVTWFAAPQTEAVVRDLFRLSDVMVSIPGYDGLSASLLQALACKVMPVLSDIEGSQDLIRSGVGLTLLPNHNSSVLFDIVVNCKHLLKTKEWNDTLEKNHEWVQQHANLKSCTQEFLRKVSELISEEA